MAILTLQGLKKNFGGLQVVDDVSLAVNRNQVHCVIGPNGAGKTTLFRLVMGQCRPDNGTIMLNDCLVTQTPSRWRRRLGMSLAAQIPQVVPDLTVLQILLVSAGSPRGVLNGLCSHRVRESEMAAATEVLRSVGLESQLDRIAATLSHADRKLLEIATALMNDPSVLLLDEPAAGLDEDAAKELPNWIVKWSKNRAVLLIEHRGRVLEDLRSRNIAATCLHEGRMIFSQGSLDDCLRHPAVREAYFGREREHGK